MISYIRNGQRVVVGGATDDAIMLRGTLEIAEASDLNNLTAIGNYFKQLTTFQVTNAPEEASGVTSQFRLTVEKALGPDSNIIKQTLELISGVKFERRYNGAWGKWKEIGAGGGGSADFPSGGTYGQFLKKASNADNDVSWGDAIYNFDTIEEMNTAIGAGLVPADGAIVNVSENPPVNPEGDDEVDEASNNWVKNSGVAAALALKANSTDVTDALDLKANKDEVVSEEAFGILGAKNVFPSNVLYSSAVAGISFILNDDGSVTCDGTSTSDAYLNSNLFTIEKGEYILNINDAEGDDVLCRIQKLTSDGGWVDNLINTSGTKEAKFNVDYDGYGALRLVVHVPNGKTVINRTVYPMIRPASINNSDYVPYAMSNRELTKTSKVAVSLYTDKVNTGYVHIYRLGKLRIINGDFNPSIAGTSSNRNTIANLSSEDYPLTSACGICGRPESESSNYIIGGVLFIEIDGRVQYQGRVTNNNLFFNIVYLTK